MEPLTGEARERDILLKAEAVEALRTIRVKWEVIQKHGGVGVIEVTSKNGSDFSDYYPSMALPQPKELEAPLRQLSAEWMSRFVTAAEALCLDVIERGEAAIPKAEKESPPTPAPIARSCDEELVLKAKTLELKLEDVTAKARAYLAVNGIETRGDLRDLKESLGEKSLEMFPMTEDQKMLIRAAIALGEVVIPEEQVAEAAMSVPDKGCEKSPDIHWNERSKNWERKAIPLPVKAEGKEEGR